MNAKPCIIAYDIQSDRRRRKALHILREWRIDGQLSVHECKINVSEAEELFAQLAEVIDPKTDRLLLSWIQVKRRGAARGKGRVLRPALKIIN